MHIFATVHQTIRRKYSTPLLNAAAPAIVVDEHFKQHTGLFVDEQMQYLHCNTGWCCIPTFSQGCSGPLEFHSTRGLLTVTEPTNYAFRLLPHLYLNKDPPQSVKFYTDVVNTCIQTEQITSGKVCQLTN